MSTLTLNQALSYSAMNVSNANQYRNYTQPYQRNEEASFAGIFCLFVPVIFTYFCIADNVFFDAFNIYLNIMVTGGLIFRVIAYNWVGNIAQEQNRSTTAWQYFSIIFPSISLITLGYTTRLQPTAVVAQQQVQTTTTTEVIATTTTEVAVEEYVVEEELLRKAS